MEKNPKKTDKKVNDEKVNASLDDVITEEEKARKQLTPLEMSQLRLHESRVQLQLNLREKFKLQEKLMNINYTNELSVLRGKVAGCDASIAEAQSDYNNQILEVEKRLHVKLPEYVIQDDGTLIDPGPPDDPEEPPAG